MSAVPAILEQCNLLESERKETSEDLDALES